MRSDASDETGSPRDVWGDEGVAGPETPQVLGRGQLKTTERVDHDTYRACRRANEKNILDKQNVISRSMLVSVSYIFLIKIPWF